MRRRLPINRLEYHVGTGKYFKMGAVGDVTDIRVSRRNPGGAARLRQAAVGGA